MVAVTVSKKGWVVIPSDIRKRYGIRPGDKLHIVDYAGRIAIVPAMKDPIREARGSLKGDASLTNALLEERRQELNREDGDILRWAASNDAS